MLQKITYFCSTYLDYWLCSSPAGRESNSKPLQCSWLENPMDGGAWWAAIYGVAQSWTQLKWLSSSSSSLAGLSPLRAALVWSVRHSMEKCEHLAFSPDIFTVRLGERSASSETTTEKFLVLNITLFEEGDNRLRLIKYSLKNTIFFTSSPQSHSWLVNREKVGSARTRIAPPFRLKSSSWPCWERLLTLSLCIWWLVIITRLPFPS